MSSAPTKTLQLTGDETTGFIKHSSAMKIFLEDKTTGLYFTKAGKWSKSSSEALSFPSYEKAVELAADLSLNKVHVVLKFEDYPYDITLPLHAPAAQARASG